MKIGLPVRHSLLKVPYQDAPHSKVFEAYLGSSCAYLGHLLGRVGPALLHLGSVLPHLEPVLALIGPFLPHAGPVLAHPRFWKVDPMGDLLL